MTKQTLKVKGMHCASCQTIITRAVSKLPGVKNISVNFANEKANLEYEPHTISVARMNEEIGKLGYSFEETDHSRMSMEDHSAHLGLGQSKPEKAAELAEMRSKAEFVVPLSLAMFIVMMWDIAAQYLAWLPNVPLPMETLNVIGLSLATPVLFWAGRPFLHGVMRFIRYRAANMDTLVGIGTLTAFIYSLIITLFPHIRVLYSLPEYTYFDVTIVVVGFIILGKYLEARSKERTGAAIEELLGLQAKTALLWRDGREVEVPAADVKVGDIVVVKPGAKIPVDGKITEGSSTVDESMVTGESMLADKKAGDLVVGATINKQGYFKFTATKVGGETLLSQIIRMVEEAQGSKAPIQSLADRISAVFVPVVLAIAVLALVVWLTVGSSAIGFSSALSHGLLSFVGILVIACPCALGLATPTAIIVGVGKGAKEGILIKNAEALERLSRIDTVVVDKTGTITKGSPEVTDVIAVDPKFSVTEIANMAASVETFSEHPIAQAIIVKAGGTAMKAENFRALEGVGVEAHISGKVIRVSKPGAYVNPRLKELERQGKTVVVVEVGGVKAGLIALSDSLKPEARDAIVRMHKRGIKVVMLTGDNTLAANHIAEEAGIDTVIAEVLPTEKAAQIKKLQSEGRKVAMVGDGINDAPALAQADVGIAMATGTDVAIESAGITLLHGDVSKLAKALRLSEITMRGIRQNLFWAFIYNIIGIPLAAGLLYPFFGWLLSPVFAGSAMALSSVSVVGNSLRIRGKKL